MVKSLERESERAAGLRYSLATLAIGLATLAVLTRLCLDFQTSFATAGYVYLIAVAVVSLFGSAASSALLCLVAVASLNYFFTEPRYSFRVADPEQVIDLIGLLVAAFIVIFLVRRGRVLAGRAVASEQQAQSAAARLRDVLDRVPALIWSMAPDGSSVVANARFREYTSTSAGRGADEFLFPAVIPGDRALEEWRAALEAGRYFETEIRLQGSNGEYRRFQLRFMPHVDDEGRVVEWYGTGSDFEERRRAEEAVAEQARLLDLTHDAIFVRDERNAIRYWNRAAQELYGWASEEAVGRVKQELLQTVFPIPLDDITAELHRTGRWEGELVHTKRDGTRVVVASRWSLQRDAGGTPIGVLETNNDITARKHAEQALREAQTALLHVTRVSTLGEVTANLAHELNQPLGAIVNNAHACLALLPGDRAELEEVREALSDIAAGAERASAVIARVRALATRGAPDPVEVRLAEVVRDVLALADAEAVARRVVIRADVPEDLPVVLGDRVQLQQVLLNLVVNAIDAMRDVDSERRIRIRSAVEETEDAGPAVVIRVEDRGIGLKADQMDRLFEPYYTTKPHGMGLGLAICHSIITAHGGRLWAESNPESGAVFSFRLPLGRAVDAPLQTGQLR